MGYHQAGLTNQAIAAIERASQLGPPDYAKFKVLQRAGQIYEAAGQTEEALAAYSQVLSLRPNDRIAQEALDRLTEDR